MKRHNETLDVRAAPDVAHLARRVCETGDTVTLTEDGEVLAVLTPPRGFRRRTVKRKRWDEQAFWEAVGSWQGIIDGEQLKKDITASRGSDRPTHEV